MRRLRRLRNLVSERIPYPYKTSPTDRYILALDKKEILRGTELDCWTYLHHNTGQSVSYALEYGGYSIEPEEG